MGDKTLTLTVVVVIQPVGIVYDTRPGPVEIPVMIPVVPPIEIVELELLQVPPGVGFVNVSVWPVHNVFVPTLGMADKAFTVTVYIALQLPSV